MARIQGRQGVCFSQDSWWGLWGVSPSASAPAWEVAQQLKLGPAAGAFSLGSLTVLPRRYTRTLGSFAAEAEVAFLYRSYLWSPRAVRGRQLKSSCLELRNSGRFPLLLLVQWEGCLGQPCMQQPFSIPSFLPLAASSRHTGLCSGRSAWVALTYDTCFKSIFMDCILGNAVYFCWTE